MKRLLFLVQLFFIIVSVHSQKINPSYSFGVIDTIFFFVPVGDVFTIQQNKWQKEPIFTKMVGDTLNKWIMEQFPAFNIAISNSFVLNGSSQKEILNNLNKIENIDEQVFTSISTGDFFDSLLNNFPGRYFGFIYYEGYLNNQINGTLIKSIPIMIITTLVTA